MSEGSNFTSKRASLCWRCKNSVPKKDHDTGEYISGCNWSLKKLPVEGWKATRADVNLAPGRSLVSYNVHKCPLFVEG